MHGQQNIKKCIDVFGTNEWNNFLFPLPLEHANVISMEFLLHIFLKFTLFFSVFTFIFYLCMLVTTDTYELHNIRSYLKLAPMRILEKLVYEVYMWAHRNNAWSCKLLRATDLLPGVRLSILAPRSIVTPPLVLPLQHLPRWSHNDWPLHSEPSWLQTYGRDQWYDTGSSEGTQQSPWTEWSWVHTPRSRRKCRWRCSCTMKPPADTYSGTTSRMN